jgi:hypothetical protein
MPVSATAQTIPSPLAANVALAASHLMVRAEV